MILNESNIKQIGNSISYVAYISITTTMNYIVWCWITTDIYDEVLYKNRFIRNGMVSV
jgi:hypothetical protein